MPILKTMNAVYVNGEWMRTDVLEPVVNPADETIFAEAPVGQAEHVEAALEAARTAFDKGPWPRMTPRERQAKMTEFLDAIERRKDEIIDLIITEAGSTPALARLLHFGIPMQHGRAAIELAARPAITPLPVETTPQANGTSMLGAGVMVRDPVGVVAAITPYNFPFFLNVGKIVPALVLGNTLILKPSPYTPFEALILGEIADEIGLPKGVLNIVTGDLPVGERLTTDRRVDLVHFTGSDKVGEKIQAQAAPTLKRVIMELGGKSALIVRPDADVAKAAAIGMGGFTIHSGQGCALLTRHLVHNAVKQQYLDAMRGMLAKVKVGHPRQEGTTMGPLIREVARQRTENYVEIAQSQGARLIHGGQRPDGMERGYYYEPTLFADVSNDHRIAQEEVFGPIGVVIGFDSDEEAIEIANDSDFGLSGGIFSGDVGKAYDMALQIRTGGVSINGGSGRMSSHAPFGGIKRSGYGREYGLEGLNEFTNIKTISFHAA
nr:aldehyde dehydrogenase family protein [Sphingomonas sp. CDS-1]